jgi:hypothetical protein
VRKGGEEEEGEMISVLVAEEEELVVVVVVDGLVVAVPDVVACLASLPRMDTFERVQVSLELGILASQAAAAHAVIVAVAGACLWTRCVERVPSEHDLSR